MRLLAGQIMPNKAKRRTGQDSAIGIIGGGWVKAAARAYAPVRVMPKCAEAACAYLAGLERARKGV